MTRDHSKLICDIGELTALFTGTANLDGLLQNIASSGTRVSPADEQAFSVRRGMQC
jgi:hypothetical protein